MQREEAPQKRRRLYHAETRRRGEKNKNREDFFDRIYQMNRMSGNGKRNYEFMKKEREGGAKKLVSAWILALNRTPASLPNAFDQLAAQLNTRGFNIFE